MRHEQEDYAVAGQPAGVGRHGENERCVEGENASGIGELGWDFGGVERSSDGESGVVCECENAGLDGGVAVEGDIGGIEAVEYEIEGGSEVKSCEKL